MTAQGSQSRLGGVLRLYASHCWNLFRPGATPRFADIYGQFESGDLSQWTSDELALLVEEGRLQIDRQRSQLARIQSRSQFLLTTSLGALLLAVNLLAQEIPAESSLTSLTWVAVLLILTVVLLVMGALGAASNLGAKNRFGAIDTSLLSNVDPPVDLALATAYVEYVRPGENTLATRLTIYWVAILLVLTGSILLAVAWVFAQPG